MLTVIGNRFHRGAGRGRPGLLPFLLCCGITAWLIATPARAELSSGCGSSPLPEAPESVTLNGEVRKFITVIPEHYQPDAPHRLIFAFHGRTNSNTEVRSYYRLEREAPTDTLYVYPSATVNDDGTFSWWKRGDSAADLRDYALFDSLLALFASRYCVDLERVFVVGHSLGATFANSLACARGEKIRAAATLGGGIVAGNCSGRVAAMVLHNPKDNLVAIAEGERVRDSYLTQNALPSPPQESEPREFNCLRYGANDERYPVLWCPHGKDYNGRGKFYPHTWPPEAGHAVMAFLTAL